MVILILEKVSGSVRGELSRWMIEPRTGVFVGSVSAMVRDRLWETAMKGAGKSGGGAMLLYSSPTEQGFKMQIFGETTRDLVDWEGLTLVHVPTKARRPGVPVEVPPAPDELSSNLWEGYTTASVEPKNDKPE